MRKCFQVQKYVSALSYYVAKNNKAFSDMKGLVDLANKLKVEVLDEYANNSVTNSYITYPAV
jgi:hypothetical protein